MPGVEVRIVRDGDVLVQGNENHTKVQESYQSEDMSSGELHVKGDSLFQQYWNKPEETTKVLTKEGWFKTGKILSLFIRGDNWETVKNVEKSRKTGDEILVQV